MNRTIEQWMETSEHVGNSFLIQAISDLQELARQRDELCSALQIAHDHIDMAALEISHCKDAAVIRSAIFSAKEQTK